MATRIARRPQPWNLAAGALLLVTTAACGPAPTPAAAPLPVPAPPVVEATAEPVDPDDADLIEAYWTARQQAWDAGLGSGVAFLVEHLHPDLPYTAQECTTAWFGPEPPSGFVERSSFDPESLQRDDGWTMRTGPLQDTELDGEVYVMEVAMDYAGAPQFWAGRSAPSHLEVLDGQVRNFLRCDIPQVTISAVDGMDFAVPTPTATTSPQPTVTALPTTTPSWSPRPYPTTPKPTTPAPKPTPSPQPTPTPSPTPSVPPTEDPGAGLDFCTGDGIPAGEYRTCPADASGA